MFRELRSRYAIGLRRIFMDNISQPAINQNWNVSTTLGETPKYQIL
jgi:hypothetical protein